MSRKRTARQVKRARRNRFLLTFLMIIAICLVLGVIIKNNFFRDLNSKGLFMAYECPESVLTMEASDVSSESPVLFASNLCALTADSELDPSIVSEAGIIINRTTGELVYSKNGRETLYPASVTKTMTLLVALQYGDLSSTITVQDYMISNLDPDSSVAGLHPGDTLNLEQLLYGLMLPSGNDAANAIAYLIAGGEQEFVSLMNDTALRIGATGCHFMNAHGLNDELHYVTAYDIYLIYNELMKYDTFYEIIGADQYRTTYTNNGNPVENLWMRGIWYFTGKAQSPAGVTPIGGKTGTTPEAQFCLSLAAKDDNGDQYVAVVLRAGSRDDLYQSMTGLLAKIHN